MPKKKVLHQKHFTLNKTYSLFCTPSGAGIFEKFPFALDFQEKAEGDKGEGKRHLHWNNINKCTGACLFKTAQGRGFTKHGCEQKKYTQKNPTRANSLSSFVVRQLHESFFPKSDATGSLG